MRCSYSSCSKLDQRTGAATVNIAQRVHGALVVGTTAVEFRPESVLAADVAFFVPLESRVGMGTACRQYQREQRDRELLHGGPPCHGGMILERPSQGRHGASTLLSPA